MEFAFPLWNKVYIPCVGLGYDCSSNVSPRTLHRKEKNTHTVWGVTKSRTVSLWILFRVAEITIPHRVWNRVYNVRVRSEIGHRKSCILVWYRVKIFRTGRHTPTQKYYEYETPTTPAPRGEKRNAAWGLLRSFLSLSSTHSSCLLSDSFTSPLQLVAWHRTPRFLSLLLP